VLKKLQALLISRLRFFIGGWRSLRRGDAYMVFGSFAELLGEQEKRAVEKGTIRRPSVCF